MRARSARLIGLFAGDDGVIACDYATVEGARNRRYEILRGLIFQLEPRLLSSKSSWQVLAARAPDPNTLLGPIAASLASLLLTFYALYWQPYIALHGSSPHKVLPICLIQLLGLSGK